MTGAEIHLKFKAWLEDRVTSKIARIPDAVTSAGKAAQKVCGSLGAALGGMAGEAGKWGNAIVGVFESFRTLGAIGAVFAATQVAVGVFFDRAKQGVQEFQERIERMAARVRERAEAVNRARLDRLAASLKEATTLAERAARSFDTMAAAYMKVQNAKAATRGAASDAAIAGMELEKSTAMAAAPEHARALVGAGHDVEIARAKLARATEAAADAVAAAAKAEKDAHLRLRLANGRETAAKRALAEAKEELALTEQVEPKKAAEWRARVEAAETALAQATNDRVTREADLAAAGEKLRQAQLGQTAAIGRARRDLVEAQSEKSGLELSRRRADEAEAARRAAEAAKRRAEDERKLAQERREAERALVEQRRAEVEALKSQRGEQMQQAALFRSQLAEARSDLANAWHLYRDKAAMKAVMDEEAAQKSAERAWEKDFDRLRSRRRDWRTAENLSADDRATREVALAKERQGEAERNLAKIEAHTAGLDEKIDHLLRLKGGD